MSGALSGTGVDAIALELVKGRIGAARAELEAMIERTAMSPVIREKKDYFVAFFSRDGRLVSGSTFPLGANALDSIFEHYEPAGMADGDLYAYNDPYLSAGGVSHSSDMVIARPVFHAGELVAFVQVFGHLWDVGGLVPGTISPLAREVFHEGLRCPPVRLQSAGVLDESVLRIVLANTRFPEMTQGDLRALMAACALGATRLRELFEDFGRAVTEQVLEAIFEQGERVVRSGFRALPDGAHAFTERIDPQPGQPERPYVELRLLKEGERITVDARGSADQSATPINFLMDRSVIGMMYGMYFMGADPTVNLSAGMLTAVEDVLLRPGSILAPRPPAPLGMRGGTWGHTNSAVLGTLAVASGGNAPACSASYVVYYLRGFDPEAERYVFLMDGLGVGYGARPFADGHDAVYYIAQKNLPVEFIEMQWPVRLLQYGVHQDSGGPGRFRGGVGVVRRVEVLHDGFTFASRVGNVAYPPWGVDGGREGGAGRVVRNPGTEREQVLSAVSEDVRLERGEVLEVRTSGGGGWGDPRTRDPRLVLQDVLAGFVSEHAARDEYGVALDVAAAVVDQDATEALRSAMPAPTGLFHQRGEYTDAFPRPG